MHKTSVKLSSEEVARPARLAAQQGTSPDEIIRRAIKVYQPERRGDRNFALVGSADGPGGSVADQTKAELLDCLGS